MKRLATEQITPYRLNIRTEGQNNSLIENKFLVSGIGSIGSNLVFFLNSLNKPEFKLVDPDKLRTENIYRHFLGFSSIGNYKTKAVENYLRTQIPIQKVSTREESIINVCRKEIDFVNEVDYIFSATGEVNIDLWIGEAIKSRIITKPVFFLWVEPYLVGGHCIFIHPESTEYTNYFDEDQLFKYNIIHKDEYLKGNEHLSLREAGCQTTYTPYSLEGVLGYLAKIFSKIISIIKDEKKRSVSYTWLGKFDRIRGLGLQLSEFGLRNESNDIIENIL